MLGPAPPRSVIDWLNRQDTEMLYLSTITMAERDGNASGFCRTVDAAGLCLNASTGSWPTVSSSKLVTSINAP